jgi:hypothetical protein
MAHEKKKSTTGKGKRDKQQKADRLNSDKKRKKISWDGTSGHPQKKGLNAFILNLDSVKRECFTLSSLNDENSCKNSFLSR